MSLVSLLRLGALASLERLWPCSEPACQLAVPFVWASDIHIKSGTKCWLVPCSAWSLFSADKSFWHDVTITSCLVQPASIISFWSFRGLYVLHCKYFDKSMRTPIKEVKRMHCAHKVAHWWALKKHSLAPCSASNPLILNHCSKGIFCHKISSLTLLLWYSPATSAMKPLANQDFEVLSQKHFSSAGCKYLSQNNPQDDWIQFLSQNWNCSFLRGVKYQLLFLTLPPSSAVDWEILIYLAFSEIGNALLYLAAPNIFFPATDSWRLSTEKYLCYGCISNPLLHCFPFSPTCNFQKLQPQNGILYKEKFHSCSFSSV